MSLSTLVIKVIECSFEKLHIDVSYKLYVSVEGRLRERQKNSDRDVFEVNYFRVLIQICFIPFCSQRMLFLWPGKGQIKKIEKQLNLLQIYEKLLHSQLCLKIVVLILFTL